MLPHIILIKTEWTIKILIQLIWKRKLREVCYIVDCKFKCKVLITMLIVYEIHHDAFMLLKDNEDMMAKPSLPWIPSHGTSSFEERLKTQVVSAS